MELATDSMGDFTQLDEHRFLVIECDNAQGAAALPLDAARLLLIDDNNYPFSTGRNPSLPDDNELIIVRTGALKG
ncbi:MAG TPA: hypothetical protein VGJ77_15245 [Gaiellaceae bacterium]|jgi:hypothetical protein